MDTVYNELQSGTTCWFVCLSVIISVANPDHVHCTSTPPCLHILLQAD